MFEVTIEDTVPITLEISSHVAIFVVLPPEIEAIIFPPIPTVLFKYSIPTSEGAPPSCIVA